MPQLNNVILTDSDGIDHTFTPNNISGGVATLVESTGVPIGDKRISVSSVQTAQGRRKMTIKLAVPVVQDAVVNGVSRPTVVRTAYADLTMTFDPTSSKKERLDVTRMLADLSIEGMMNAVVGDLQGLY